MKDYRAPRVWHIEPRHGRYYVVNQFGGFEGWSDTYQDACDRAAMYETAYGDRWDR